MSHKYKSKFVGKMHGYDTYIFRLNYKKATKQRCEHCGTLSRKVWFTESNSPDEVDFSGNIFWCSTCALNGIDMSPDAEQKFQKGQDVYYLNGMNNKVKAKVLYYSCDKYVEVEVIDSYGDKCKIGVDESDLFNIKN